MKNAVFWDVVPCRYCVNRRFGGTYRLHLQGRKIRERGTSVRRWLQRVSVGLRIQPQQRIVGNIVFYVVRVVTKEAISSSQNFLFLIIWYISFFFSILIISKYAGNVRQILGSTLFLPLWGHQTTCCLHTRICDKFGQDYTLQDLKCFDSCCCFCCVQVTGFPQTGSSGHASRDKAASKCRFRRQTAVAPNSIRSNRARLRMRLQWRTHTQLWHVTSGYWTAQALRTLEVLFVLKN
jgi:hypothetical protein